MTRLVVNVATTEYYQRGQTRLLTWLAEHGEHWLMYATEPRGCPKHSDVPYAMKAYALKEAAKQADLLLWCDSSILPIRNLGPLWEQIERDGYWFSRNGWTNYEWTADSAYLDLFPEMNIVGAREYNKSIPHVVATAFGLNVRSEIGAAFLAGYYRVASKTRAFCGPWVNSLRADFNITLTSTQHPAGPCGPPDVLGHRHDQTCASVIAWRLGMRLDESGTFAYAGGQNDITILTADGNY